MKRYLCLIICMMISLILLSGCVSSNTNTTEGIKNTVNRNDSVQSVETNDWEPSTYETVNDLVGVIMVVKDGTVSPAGLTVTFENSSDKQCTYGEYFLLEKKINEKWFQVPTVIDNYGFNSIGYELAPGKNGEWKIDWDWLYGNLDTGEYRIVKDILDFRSTGDYDNYYLAAEFTVD